MSLRSILNLPTAGSVGTNVGNAIGGMGSLLSGAVSGAGEAAKKTGNAAVNTGTGIAHGIIDANVNAATGLAAGTGAAIDNAVKTGTSVVGNIPGLSGQLPGNVFMPTTPIHPTLPINPPMVFPIPALAFDRTTTQLAERAIKQLENAKAEDVREAINTVKNTLNQNRMSANRLLSYLERKVRVGEVLQNAASTWLAETHKDFGEAFRMDPGKKTIMDSIVSISLLNDDDLDDEIRMENIDSASDNELLESRRIVWQYPPAGTPLEPPYTVLIAVEHRDMAEAQKVVDRIMNSLKVRDGLRLPSQVVAHLG